MINYVQNKNINYNQIQELLEESSKVRRFTNGGPVKFKLETHLHQLLKLPANKSILCTNSGTSALHTLMYLFEARSDKKKFFWGTIAYNFPSVVVGGFTPKIFDIELSKIDNTFGYVIKLNKALQKCDGFVMPSLFGTLPTNFDNCVKFCKDNQITLILDNASSPLSTHKGHNICALGDASISSLHHTKYLGFGESGFLVIDQSLYQKADTITNFGFFQNRKYNSRSSNFKMSDINAAFILSHLYSYDVSKHKRVQEQFAEKLNIFNYNSAASYVYGNLPITFQQPTSQLLFRDYGIEANKYYLPLSRLPNSNFLYERMVNFPLHAELSEYEISKIIEQILLQMDKQQ